VTEAGRHDVRWRAPEEPGSYSVRVEASDGRAERLSEVVEIAVREPSRDAGPGRGGSDTAPLKRSEDRTWIYVLVLVLALIALVVKWLAGRIGR